MLEQRNRHEAARGSGVEDQDLLPECDFGVLEKPLPELPSRKGDTVFRF